jgi:adenylate cyclase
MPGALQVQVVDRQQIVYTAEFSGPVELGRQIDAQETMYRARPVEAGHWRGVLSMLTDEARRISEEHFKKAGLSRAIIAQLNEDTVSRHHALLEPLGNRKVRLSNVSSKVPIRLPDDRDLPAGKVVELDLPVALVLGRKTVRIRTPDPRPSRTILAAAPAVADSAVAAAMRRLDQPSIAPGQMSAAATRFPTLATTDTPQLEEIVRWLQSTMGVLQAATSSTDFFQRAAQAVVDNVGCDRGAVLLLKGDEWRIEALCNAPTVQPDPNWTPSTTLLAQVLAEKGTCWQSPDRAASQPESLVNVEIVVGSPILDGDRKVIGAIYGDCEFDVTSNARTRITRLEAMLVDLLAGGVATGLARMQQEKAALEADVRFGQFFTKELSQELARNPDLLKGRDEDVTLMFVDIRAFSRISERLGPAGTVEWIGDIMNELSDCVLQHRGVLVDYIGDELMAMWGAPEAQPDHPLLACRAALDMLAALPRLSARWLDKLGEPVRLGIGVNTGRARVGNTGSKHKFKYGPLGHHVNLASRVQGATKYLRTPLLVTEFTRSLLGNGFDLRRLCRVRVVNIQQPVGLYELVPPNLPDWTERVKGYEEALAKFEEAGALMERCHATLPPTEQFRVEAEQALRGVNSILGNLLRAHPEDGPAMLLISRSINALIAGLVDFDPVWELPGK